MNFDKIDKILANEPKWRAKQVRQLIWHDLIASWDEATTLPVALREKLAQGYPLEIKAEVFPDKDGKSAKALIVLEDGLSVETVLMRHTLRPNVTLRQAQGIKNTRNTVCVSSQIGCPLGCVFCATGKMGFKRNLSVSEIAEQVLFWARWLKKSESVARVAFHTPAGSPRRSAPRDDNRVNNVVFMGMGEPFLNYDNVFEAIKILNNDNYLAIGARHISISTAGVVEGIERMSEDMPQINLAISLHAAK